jgi:hypothetical protein
MANAMLQLQVCIVAACSCATNMRCVQHADAAMQDLHMPISCTSASLCSFR